MTERDGTPRSGADAAAPEPEAQADEVPAARRLAQLAPLLLPVVVAPLLGGTAERPYTLLVAACCGALALWTGWRRPEPRVPVSWFTLLLALATGVTLLQVVPLPPAVRGVLAAGSDPTLRLLLAESGPAAWLPLSVDPAATWNEAARLLGYLCLLLALAHRLRRRGDSRLLVGAVVLAAGLVALLGLAAGLGVELPPPVGIPADARTRALLPAALHNPNHLAALLSVGAVLTIGLIAGADRSSGMGPRALWGVLVLLDVALLGTLSRAGVALGLLAQAVTALLLLDSPRRPSRTGRRAGLGLRLGLGVLFAAGLAALLLPSALPSLVERFHSLPRGELSTPGSKVEAWREALPLLAGHWPLGVGRGAFELAFQGTHRLSATTRFVYLENTWLQLVLDWGVPAGGALLGLGLLGLRDAVRVRRPGPSGRRRRAALAALILLAAHDVVDFSLEVGGVAVAAIALLALCERARHHVSTRWLLGLGGGAVALALFAALRCPSHDEDGARLRERVQRPDATTASVLALGREVTRRHPLDSYLWATVAAWLQRDGEAAAAAWVNRALLANPRDVGARQVGALLLAEHGHRAQALELLRQALSDGDFGQRRWLYRTAVRLAAAGQPAELLAAVPADPARRPVLLGELLDELGSLQPVPWSLVRGVAQAALQEGAPSLAEPAALWSGRAVLAQHDVAAAASAASRLRLAAEPAGSALLWAGLIDLLIDGGDPSQQARAAELATAAATASTRPEPHRALGRLATRAGRLDEARQHLERGLQLARDDQTAALLHDARAELEERAGNLHRAELERSLAARRRSGDRP
ncbi:MAG: tetratricopeptide repeat protein [Polyangia bacterium]